MGQPTLEDSLAVSYQTKAYKLYHCGCCLVAKSCLTLLRPCGQEPARLLCPWDFPGKNTEVGCHFLLKGMFLTQKLNPSLLHWLPWWLSGKDSACQSKRHRFDPVLSWDNPLEKEMATHSCILAWKIPMNRGAWWATVPGVTKSWT